MSFTRIQRPASFNPLSAPITWVLNNVVDYFRGQLQVGGKDENSQHSMGASNATASEMAEI
jgi:hypothetical protein